MKSSLRSLVAVVLAVLAGTFFSVRGYLETLGPRQPHASSTSWLRQHEPSQDLAPSFGVPDIDPEVQDRMQDDNCPTCAATLDEAPLLPGSKLRVIKAAS